MAYSAWLDCAQKQRRNTKSFLVLTLEHHSSPRCNAPRQGAFPYVMIHNSKVRERKAHEPCGRKGFTTRIPNDTQEGLIHRNACTFKRYLHETDNANDMNIIPFANSALSLETPSPVERDICYVDAIGAASDIVHFQQGKSAQQHRGGSAVKQSS